MCVFKDTFFQTRVLLVVKKQNCLSSICMLPTLDSNDAKTIVDTVAYKVSCNSSTSIVFHILMCCDVLLLFVDVFVMHMEARYYLI